MFVHRSGDHTVGVEQYGAVVGKAAGQGMASALPWNDRLRDREASRMLFEAFDAEQLGANGITAEPRGWRRFAPNDAINKR
jgi:hypothetical protein